MKLLLAYPGNMAVHIAMLSTLDPIDFKRLGVLPFWNNESSDVSIKWLLKKIANHHSFYFTFGFFCRILKS